MGFGTCNDLRSNPIAIFDKIAKFLCIAHGTWNRIRTARKAIALVLSPAGARGGTVTEMCAGGRHQTSLAPFWSDSPAVEIRNWLSTRSGPGRPVALRDRARTVV